MREFWHLAMSGEPDVDEREVLAETIEQISCRWCGAVDRIELVARPQHGGPADDATGDGGP